jgi:formate dehydrogenase assembly factor FdhD
MAGIPVLAAVSAPSSLAVDLPTEVGLTLVAFLCGDSMNVHTEPHHDYPGLYRNQPPRGVAIPLG